MLATPMQTLNTYMLTHHLECQAHACNSLSCLLDRMGSGDALFSLLCNGRVVPSMPPAALVTGKGFLRYEGTEHQGKSPKTTDTSGFHTSSLLPDS